VESRGLWHGVVASRSRAYTALFVSLVLVYAGLLLVSPALGPNDDYAFLSTLQSGRPLPPYGHNFPFYDDARIGRFDPLVAQEYNLVARISATPAAYYALNAIELLIFAALLYAVLRGAARDIRIATGAALLLFLSPGMTNAWFRLELGERGAALFLVAFLAAHLRLQRSGSLWAAALAVVAANVALYYKEPVFLALGTYAAAHLVLSRRDRPKIVTAVDALVITGALLFVLLYFVDVSAVRGPWRYSNSVYPWSVVATKNLLNYTLFSDPLIMLLLLPLTATRAYAVWVWHEPPHAVFDSMLLAGCAYTSVFFVANIYGPYYLLPAYVFALPALLYFLAGRRYLERPAWKAVAVCAAAVLAVDTLPMGLHYLTYNKYLPVNFNRTIAFLASDIEAGGQAGRTRIFIDGVHRAQDTTVFFIFGEFLRHRGLRPEQFDVESDVAPTRPAAPATLRPRYLMEYGAYRGGPVPTPAAGDYRVVSPASEQDITAPYLASLRRNYRLVFATTSPLAFPAYTAKTAVKELLDARLTADLKKRQGLIVSENTLERPDFYVFVHK
jgi:hypothetical protein